MKKKELCRFHLPTKRQMQFLERQFESYKNTFSRYFPNSEIYHVGSTAVDGLLTKGDMDIFIRTRKQDFTRIRNAIFRRFGCPNPYLTNTFASVSYKQKNLDLGIQIAVIGSKQDMFHTFRNAVAESELLRKKYNLLKKCCTRMTMDAYRKRKSKFIVSVINKRR